MSTLIDAVDKPIGELEKIFLEPIEIKKQFTSAASIRTSISGLSLTPVWYFRMQKTWAQVFQVSFFWFLFGFIMIFFVKTVKDSFANMKDVARYISQFDSTDV